MRPTVFFGVAAMATLLTGCATSSPDGIRKQMGPQTFNEPNIPIAGGGDTDVLHAVEAAVSVSSEFGFRHDASGSRRGRVDIEALWQGRLIKLKMRFQRRESQGPYKVGIYLTSRLTQPADVFLEKGGQKIESLFYTRLLTVTTQRGLTIYGDPNLDPELMD